MENTLTLRDDQIEILNHHKTLPLGDANNNTLKFKDILWRKDYEYHKTYATYQYRAIVDFNNGWYVSIINGQFTYSEYNEYEMAIFNSDGQMINPFGDLYYFDGIDEWCGNPIHGMQESDVEEYLLKTSKADFK